MQNDIVRPTIMMNKEAKEKRPAGGLMGQNIFMSKSSLNKELLCSYLQYGNYNNQSSLINWYWGHCEKHYSVGSINI